MLGVIAVLVVSAFACQFCQCKCKDSSERVISVSTNCVELQEQPENSVSGENGIDFYCKEFSEALMLLTPDVTLELQPGIHYLKKPYILNETYNISIIGSTDTTLTCEEGAGLAFVNVINLSIMSLNITGCGMSQQGLNSSLTILEELVNIWYSIPTKLKVSVFLGHCRNVEFIDMSISNTSGLGLMGINVIGDSTFSNVSFTGNIAPTYNASTLVGGGALFLYQDMKSNDKSSDSSGSSDFMNQEKLNSLEEMSETLLTLQDSEFRHNFGYYNEEIARDKNYFHDYTTLEGTYQLQTGGGLSLILMQMSYEVRVKIGSTMFQNNAGEYGGGAYIEIFSGIHHSNVSFDNCEFYSNGLTSIIEDTADINESPNAISLKGAGLAIVANIQRMGTSDNSTPRKEYLTFVTISNTNFTNNEALQNGGGLWVHKLPNSPCKMSSNFHCHETNWIIRGCIFDNNRASQGSAGYFYQGVIRGAEGTASLTLDNVIIQDNALGMSAKYFNTTKFNLPSSALNLENIKATFKNRLDFLFNKVTALFLRSTPIVVAKKANIIFKDNFGHRGGAIHMSGELPKIILHNYTSIIFEDNTATISGGAIHIDPPTYHEYGQQFWHPFYSSCFISPPLTTNCRKQYCFNISNTLSKVRFINNTAPVGGAIYGSTLESCLWAQQLNKSSNESIYEALQDVSGFLEFNPNPDSSYIISTLPARMSIWKEDGIPINSSLDVFPGEIIFVNVQIYDSFNQTIPSLIQSSILDSNSKATAKFGSTGYWFVNYKNLPRMVVTGEVDQMVDIHLIDVQSLVSEILTVNILKCLIGFRFNSTSKRCECDGRLEENGVKCDLMDLEHLKTTKSVWLGTLKPAGSKVTTNDLVVAKCMFRYCRCREVRVIPPEDDSQCIEDFNRTGVLCGACSSKYSEVLGPHEQCLQCNNIWLLLLPVFALLGIVLFLAIAFLQLTVDKGWIYVILFYGNIATLYSYYLPLPTMIHKLMIPAHFISLQLGIQICFFDGMDNLMHTALQLVFPAYLCFLIFVSALLSRRLSCLSRYFSPTQTFLTLIVMSYTSILDSTVSMLKFTRLSTLGGDISYRWKMDPNVIYFTGWHGVLVIMSSIIIVFVVIPIPLIMLCPVLAYKYIKKFKPFFDAMWAPFKTKFRFWLGVRILTLVVIYFMADLNFTNIHGLLFIGIILCIYLQFQSSIRPFKGTLINIIDGFLITNNIILLLGLTYNLNFNTIGNKSEDIPNKIKTTFIITCLTISYALILVAFICNLLICFPKMKSLNIKQLFLSGKMKVEKIRLRVKVKSFHGYNLTEREGLTPPCTKSSLRMHPPHVKSFSQLRETLLNDTDPST